MTEFTFDVSPDVPAPQRFNIVDYARELRVELRRPIEAIWRPPLPLIVCDENHALLTAFQTAFYHHCPLRLTPDVIWITLARGFALHVRLHAEELRDRFVTHSGKEKLIVSRLDFLPGHNNPWPEVFDAFADQIAAKTGGLDKLVRADFSTTGPTERAVSSLMAMDTFQVYFEYELMAGCGIPSITIAGTPQDWKSIRSRAARFAEYGLENWVEALDPILAQFVSAAERKPDIEFWRSLFRYNSGSGPSVMTGWANVLFPYLKDGRDHLYPNPHLNDWEIRLAIDDRQSWHDRFGEPQGVGLESIPSCMNSVPIVVFWDKHRTEMRFVGGLMGVSQDDQTRMVQPECGWAIIYEEPVDPLSSHHAFMEARKRS